MSQIKPTEEGQRLRLEHLKALRERRKNLSDISGLKVTPEWAKLTKLYNEFTEFAEREAKAARISYLSGDMSLEEFGRTTIRTSQKAEDFRFCSEVIEGNQEHIESLDAEISRLEKSYKEAKELLTL
jgi:hypothetical protein